MDQGQECKAKEKGVAERFGLGIHKKEKNNIGTQHSKGNKRKGWPGVKIVRWNVDI